MATVITDDTNYTNIANAIRGKNGEATQYKPSEMAAAITNLPSGGGTDFEITDASYLFYKNARIDVVNELLALCKNVTTMASTFNGCDALTTLNLSNFDTSKVTTMASTFNGCDALTTLNLSNFDTSKVTSMASMFSSCGALTTLNLSSFDTSEVTSMSSMFNGCRKLTTLNLSSFDTSKVTTMTYMFSNCDALTTLIINNPKLFELKSTDCFNFSAIENGTGYVYVPDDMVDTYKTATNWSVYADQIKPISELPEEV